jgi:hypothetical protein
MSVIIETGVGLSDANSYVGTDEFRQFAKTRDLPHPCDNEDIQALMFKAMDYIESFSHRFPGERLLDTQALEYPRDCGPVGVPHQLKKAVMYTMIGIHTGFDPVANKSDKPFVIRESVDVIRVDYAESSQNNKNKLPMVDRLLNELLGGSAVRFIKA